MPRPPIATLRMYTNGGPTFSTRARLPLALHVHPAASAETRIEAIGYDNHHSKRISGQGPIDDNDGQRKTVDQGLLPLSFTAENGETIELLKDGGSELAEQYIRPGDWRDQFSKERIGQD